MTDGERVCNNAKNSSAKSISHPDFLLPLSYQDIGNYLGLATETISRILSQFKNSKIISIENKHIYFLQPEELKRIAIHSCSL
jgi:CRP-like cAMP-binding protein